jgi:hypothetical protein
MTSQSTTLNTGQAAFIDQVIQALYGIGLKLEYSLALVEDGPVQTRAALDSAITDLGDLIDVLRSQVTGLIGTEVLSDYD